MVVLPYLKDKKITLLDYFQAIAKATYIDWDINIYEIEDKFEKDLEYTEKLKDLDLIIIEPIDGLSIVDGLQIRISSKGKNFLTKLELYNPESQL